MHLNSISLFRLDGQHFDYYSLDPYVTRHKVSVFLVTNNHLNF